LDYNFDWDPVKEKQNRRKHGLSFRQAATIFRDPGQLTNYDDEHSEGEERWVTIGIDSGGMVRVVVHTYKQLDKDSCEIRIISARDATRYELIEYQRRAL
jgi:uncharacterized DUF497 family protein